MFEDGKIPKSDPLSVSENCSLVVKDVSDEDVGHYVCRRFPSGQEAAEDAEVYLSVVHCEFHTMLLSNFLL